ncbi:hypothetical protein Tco_1008121, partial [Tanacetum coccineum]
MAAIVSKLDNLARDMKKLMENVHAIQVGCQLCVGPHLDKECPHNKDAKSVEEAVYDDAPINNTSSNETNEIHGVSFIDVLEDDNLPSE